MSKSPPPHRAMLHHITLGTLRRIDSFSKDQRHLFEHLIGIFDMRCIDVNGARYITTEEEYSHFSACGSEWDVAAIEADYAKSLRVDGNDDVLRATYQEIAAQDRHAFAKKASIERIAKEMIASDVDNIFARALRVPSFWSDAAVIAGQFATDENVNAFSQAVAAFETALLNDAGYDHEQIEFHRQLLAMSSPSAAADFDRLWPKCRVVLRPDIDKTAILIALRRLHATVGGWRGEPYGAEMPATAMHGYLALGRY